MIDVVFCCRIVCPHVLHKVLTRQYLQSGLVKHPLRHERALGTMSVYCTLVSIEFVVHQDRKGPVPVIECAQSIGNAGHHVVADMIAHSQQRGERDLDSIAELQYSCQLARIRRIIKLITRRDRSLSCL